jgi:hypothetical protein
VHSPLISGTFELTIGGVAITVGGSSNIPFDVSAGSLQNGLRNVVGFEQVEVTQSTTYGCGYGCTWIIEYKGYNQAVPSTTVIGASLNGGSTTPSIVKTVRRSYSSNLDFNPVDYRFLSTTGAGINIQVSTNGIPSICTGTCAYAFELYSEITALGNTSAVLNLALSDPAGLNFPLSDVTVSVGGLPCTSVGGTLAAITCNMQANTDGTPILVAGQVTPLVAISQYGIVALASGVNPLSVNLVCTSLNVTTQGDNGGYAVKLTGAGFPLQTDQITIEICGKNSTIASANNLEVEFYVPSCATQTLETVTVTVNSIQDTSLTFNYGAPSSAPTVSLLNPASANPGIKGTIEIIGTNFGTDSSLIKVFLSNATGKIYQLPVLSLNDTNIKAGLPGGREGPFTLQVNHLNYGDSIPATVGADAFTYAFTVFSVSPSTGSYYGNTLLTITGENFATASQQTLVYVGDTLNWFCTVESITATQIKCRTPAISSAYKVNETQNVVVSTRLLILNACTGVCSFSYIDAASSPRLTAISSSSVTVAGSSSLTITLTGLNLQDANSFADVALTHNVTSQVIVFTALSVSATSVTFNITSALTSGQYYVQVRNAIGGSNALTLQIKLSFGTASWSSGGSIAGAIVSVTNGGGYPSSIDGKTFSLTLTAGGVIYPVKVVSCCSSNGLSLAIPAAPAGTSFTITFKGPVNSNTKTYTLSSSLTPNASITSATSVPAGSNSIQLTQTSASAVTINSIKLISTVDSTTSIAVPTWNTNAPVTSFTASLPAGRYQVLVSTSSGFFSIAQTLDVQFPSATPVGGAIGYNGGTFILTANDLSPTSYITVQGFRGAISSYSSTQVVYKVPALVTAATQASYSLASPSLIDTSSLTLISDLNGTSNGVSTAFDGLSDTFYSSSNAECWLGVDAGSGMGIAVSRIRFFPNLNWINVGKKILHAVFQGSNDQSSWTTLATVDQTIHTGWNVLKSEDSTNAYRYIRFLHNSTSQCKIAEFQLYGVTYSDLSVTLASQAVDVIYQDGANTQTFTGALEFRDDHTPVVDLVSPRYGDIHGGYDITLTGANLNSATPVVTIDGVSCTIVTSSSTAITCTVGQRTITPTSDNTFTVAVGSSRAVLRDSFLYVLKWSSPSTWGVDMPPIANDLIYVPVGTTLMVDQDTPVLEGIAVEGGTLVFSDDLDLTVQAGFITMNGGRFIAGTEQHPHTHQLNFVLYGGYYGKQQPMFGNKGIGCLNCKFSMYGQPRNKTWTTLAATVNPGDTSLTLSEAVDWQVGEVIVVASTSFEHWESERKTITSIVGGVTVTVDSAFAFKHVSVI